MLNRFHGPHAVHGGQSSKVRGLQNASSRYLTSAATVGSLRSNPFANPMPIALPPCACTLFTTLPPSGYPDHTSTQPILSCRCFVVSRAAIHVVFVGGSAAPLLAVAAQLVAVPIATSAVITAIKLHT